MEHDGPALAFEGLAIETFLGSPIKSPYSWPLGQWCEGCEVREKSEGRMGKWEVEGAVASGRLCDHYLELLACLEEEVRGQDDRDLAVGHSVLAGDLRAA